MRELDLIRVSPRGHPKGTFGVYRDAGVPFAVTLEPPWRDNQPQVSCIPGTGDIGHSGVYTCRRIVSPKYGDVFRVEDVPGRANVLNHWGSLLQNTLGCILVAEEFGVVQGEPAVLTSRTQPGRGFNEFMLRLQTVNEYRLRITWA